MHTAELQPVWKRHILGGHERDLRDEEFHCNTVMQPETAEPGLQLARRLFADGEFTAAEAVLHDTLRLFPGNATALNALPLFAMLQHGAIGVVKCSAPDSPRPKPSATTNECKGPRPTQLHWILSRPGIDACPTGILMPPHVPSHHRLGRAGVVAALIGVAVLLAWTQATHRTRHGVEHGSVATARAAAPALNRAVNANRNDTILDSAPKHPPELPATIPALAAPLSVAPPTDTVFLPANTSKAVIILYPASQPDARDVAAHLAHRLSADRFEVRGPLAIGGHLAPGIFYASMQDRTAAEAIAARLAGVFGAAKLVPPRPDGAAPALGVIRIALP